MGRPPLVVEFDPAERAGILDVMAEMTAAGKGFINLEPHLDDVDRNNGPAAGIFAVFSVTRNAPLCTWSAPAANKKRPVPVLIGVQHGLNAKAAPRLPERGVIVPPGWRVVQDHPKKGLVLAVPPTEPAEAMLDWLVRAGEALSPSSPRGWQASI